MAKIDKNDNNYIYYWVGKNIRKYRKQNGWTQKELAKRCCYSENFIGDIENETFKTFSLNTLGFYQGGKTQFENRQPLHYRTCKSYTFIPFLTLSIS